MQLNKIYLFLNLVIMKKFLLLHLEKIIFELLFFSENTVGGYAPPLTNKVVTVVMDKDNLTCFNGCHGEPQSLWEVHFADFFRCLITVSFCFMGKNDCFSKAS